MINQLYTGTPTSRRFVTLPAAFLNSATYIAGTPILVGTEPAFMLDSYQANVGGCTCLFNGTFTTGVYGTSADSPPVNAQVNPGDALYATNGIYDSTTNVTYGFRIDKNISGVPFGHLDASNPYIPAGNTQVQAGVAI